MSKMVNLVILALLDIVIVDAHE